MKDYFQHALDHVARYGDTDIFPYPFEQHVFFDKRDEVLKLLERAEKEFTSQKLASGASTESFLESWPPVNATALAPIGYTGFRWATEIDPFWNVFLLGQVLALAENIEAERIPIDEHSVFSYRFKHDNATKSVFDPTIGWKEFYLKTRELATKHSHMLICDISDFYPRIYHHRLENALLQVAGSTPFPSRILALLGAFSGARSYGLPVGGPAARLLAELVLNSTDRLLRMHGIKFVRYVDDYHIFCSSTEETYSHLVFLTEKLANDGLALQKAKTRILKTSEYLATASLFSEPDPAEAIGDDEARLFMRLHIRYDPYSSDPIGDYERVRGEVRKFDVIGMFTRELVKSRVHVPLAKQVLRLIPYVDDAAMGTAARLIVENFETLAPVFPRSMITLRELYPKLDGKEQVYVMKQVRDLIQSNSHIRKIDINLMFAVRVLAASRSVENEAVLAALYEDASRNMILRKDVILTMAKWRNYHWVSDAIRQFSTLSDWERRACIVASYCLRDEGKHWRTHRAKQFSPFEAIVREWAAAKSQLSGWEIPV